MRLLLICLLSQLRPLYPIHKTIIGAMYMYQIKIVIIIIISSVSSHSKSSQNTQILLVKDFSYNHNNIIMTNTGVAIKVANLMISVFTAK